MYELTVQRSESFQLQEQSVKLMGIEYILLTLPCYHFSARPTARRSSVDACWLLLSVILSWCCWSRLLDGVSSAVLEVLGVCKVRSNHAWGCWKTSWMLMPSSPVNKWYECVILESLTCITFRAGVIVVDGLPSSETHWDWKCWSSEARLKQTT